MNNKSKLSSRFDKETASEEVLEIPQIIVQDESMSELKSDLMDKIDTIPVWSEYSKEQQKDMVESFVSKKVDNLSESEKSELAEDLLENVSGFGPLNFLLDNDKVSAVFVNGTHGVHIEIGGKILDTEIKLSQKQLSFIISNLSLECDKNFEDDICHCKTKDLFVTVVSSNISKNGTNLILRKIRDFSIEDLINNKMLSHEVYEFISKMIALKKNIVISGELNSGKTALLKAVFDANLFNKRCAVLEENSQINADIHFVIDSKQSEDLIIEISKMLPEYILSDLNKPVMSDDCPFIFTMNSSSVQVCLDKLTSYISCQNGLSEKFSRRKLLTDVDYIIQINKSETGLRKITSVVELKPAKTAAQSIKNVFKIVKNDYTYYES